MKEGWEVEKLEKCLEKVTYTNKIHRKDFKEQGDYPVVSQEKDLINGYWNNETDLFKVEKPIVVFGDHTQVKKYIDFDFVLGADGVKILKPKKHIDSKYFYYYLLNTELRSLGYARHYRLLKKVMISYPKSLPEQQRIVSILDHCFKAIDKAKANAEQNLRNAKELFESYLQGVFEKRGENWKNVNIDSVCEVVNGGTPKTKVKEYWNGDVNWITPADLGKLDSVLVNETSRKITELGLQKSSAKLFKENSVILSTRAPIGHLAINTVPMSTNQGCRGLVPNKNLNTWFLYYFLKGNIQLLNDLGTGATFLELSSKALKSVIIPLPPLKDQIRLVSILNKYVEASQNLETHYQKRIDDLEELKKSILQKAFAGELKTEKMVEEMEEVEL